MLLQGDDTCARAKEGVSGISAPKDLGAAGKPSYYAIPADRSAFSCSTEPHVHIVHYTESDTQPLIQLQPLADRK